MLGTGRPFLKIHQSQPVGQFETEPLKTEWRLDRPRGLLPAKAVLRLQNPDASQRQWHQRPLPAEIAAVAPCVLHAPVRFRWRCFRDQGRFGHATPAPTDRVHRVALPSQCVFPEAILGEIHPMSRLPARSLHRDMQ